MRPRYSLTPSRRQSTRQTHTPTARISENYPRLCHESGRAPLPPIRDLFPPASASIRTRADINEMTSVKLDGKRGARKIKQRDCSDMVIIVTWAKWDSGHIWPARRAARVSRSLDQRLEAIKFPRGSPSHRDYTRVRNVKRAGGARAPLFIAPAYHRRFPATADEKNSFTSHLDNAGVAHSGLNQLVIGRL